MDVISAEVATFIYNRDEVSPTVTIEIPSELANYRAIQSSGDSGQVTKVDLPLDDLEYFIFGHWREGVIDRVNDLDLEAPEARDEIIGMLQRMAWAHGKGIVSA